MYLIAILVSFLLSSCDSSQLFSDTDTQDIYVVKKVIDGDSLKATPLDCLQENTTVTIHQNKKTTVNHKSECVDLEIRLLGIDAPEYSQDPWGKRARDFVLKNIELGQTIRIEANKNDKYGRTLAYVFYKDDDGLEHMINEEMLAHGFADIFILGQNPDYLTRFKKVHAQAKEAQLNIWHSSDGIKMKPYQYRKKFMK